MLLGFPEADVRSGPSKIFAFDPWRSFGRRPLCAQLSSLGVELGIPDNGQPVSRLDDLLPWNWHDHPEISEWLADYDLDALDFVPIQVVLGRIAASRNDAAKRILKPADH